jgi:hypothetical protein
MSRSLKDYLAENAARLQAEKQKSVLRRDEWTEAVDHLRNKVKEWLHVSDPDGLFSVEETPVTIVEEGIGSYEVKGLTITLGPRVIHLTPISRAVVDPWSDSAPRVFVGARGRIDLTNGLKTYSLYRLQLDKNYPIYQWFIYDQDTYENDCFDQDKFESVMQSLLE